MPSCKTKFNTAWLVKQGNNESLVLEWCRADANDIYSGYCMLCNKSISCANAGAKQLFNHAVGQTHKLCFKQKNDKSQKQLFVIKVDTP